MNDARAQRARSEMSVTGKGWPRQYTSYVDESWLLEKEFFPDGVVLPNSVISSNWGNQKDMELVWMGEESHCTWRSHRVLVNSIVPLNGDSMVIKLDNFGYSMTSAGGSRPSPEKPFYIENAYELLDTPGEWYFNSNTKKLYYIPREGENMKTSTFYIPGNVETILSIKGSSLASKVQNLIFDGLHFRHTTWMRPNTTRVGASCVQADKYINGYGQIGRAHKAIHRKDFFYDPAYDYVVDENGEAEGFKPDACVELNAAMDIKIKNCHFEHLGAVGIDMTQGCNEISIFGNVFHDLSATTIVVGRWDQDYIGEGEEVCKDVTIQNNLIYKIGMEYYNSPGITVFYADGINIIHNEINDTSYSGMSLGWGAWGGKTAWTTSNRNYTVMYNLIKNISKICSDGGGIYTIGIGKSRVDPDSLTSRISFNYIVNTGLSYGALYPDEGSCYYECRIMYVKMLKQQKGGSGSIYGPLITMILRSIVTSVTVLNLLTKE